MKDIYKEPITISYPNFTARIHRPELTPEEREKRMAYIYKAAAELLKERK